ncbi:hypothetical protein Tchar_02423 [Tepidimonas charontis]|uniref:Uncharacterized protein n=1 Tax=Tepidimonas charontis TaxID=2267262 RepID=A0A554X432_9BURK|nr:hypothetical protein Tchar_02423 [Tepidimonas charontis]
MRVETKAPQAAGAAWLEDGPDSAPEALHILVNEAAKVERSAFVAAQPDERTATRRKDARSFKLKTMLTRLGEVTFQVLPVRTRGLPQRLRVGLPHRPNRPSRLARQGGSGCLHLTPSIEVPQKRPGPEIALSGAGGTPAAKLDAGLAS